MRIELPKKIHWLFREPLGSCRYRCAYGGRGSGKSYSFALVALVYGAHRKMRILCAREYQASIHQSFFAQLVSVLDDHPELASAYEIGKKSIVGVNGTEFIFSGLSGSTKTDQSIKSITGIDVCIVEEAEDISTASWQLLYPSVRAEGGEIWCIWNPRDRGSAMDEMFRGDEVSPRARVVEVNWRDNPWFPAVLDGDRKEDLVRLPADDYAWIWEGAYREHSEAQVLAGKVTISEFVPDVRTWDGPYYGLDFGFARDPTALVKAWCHDGDLYVEKEAGRVGLDLNDTAQYLVGRIPECQSAVIRADSSRPESISLLQRDPVLPLRGAVAVKKTTITDGIQHLRSFRRIYVHPRCEETIQECRLYSYKTNRAGDVTDAVVDAHNHYIDALRYALAPLCHAGIRERLTGLSNSATIASRRPARPRIF